MKKRPGAIDTICLLLSTPLVLTLAGCQIVIDEMIANATISTDDTKKSDKSDNNSKNSRSGGGKEARTPGELKPPLATPIVNPISDGPAAPPTPPSPPPTPTTPTPTTPTPPTPTTPTPTTPTPTTPTPPTTTPTPPPPPYSSSGSYAQNAVVTHNSMRFRRNTPGSLSGIGNQPSGCDGGASWERVEPDGSGGHRSFYRRGNANAKPWCNTLAYGAPTSGVPASSGAYYVTHGGNTYRNQYAASAGQTPPTPPVANPSSFPWLLVP